MVRPLVVLLAVLLALLLRFLALLLVQVVPQIAAGRCKAIVDSVFEIDHTVEAYDRLAGPGKFGKVLVKVG